MELSLQCKKLIQLSAQEEQGALHIRMLGGCRITNGEHEISDQKLRYKKPWLLLVYLLMTREQNLSQNDMLDMVYPEGKSENPVSALKTLIHRIRVMLDQLSFTSSKGMVVQIQGIYKWNCKAKFDVDVDIFDALYEFAEKPSTTCAERIACYERMMQMYKGKFYPKGSTCTWAIPITERYHSRYLAAADILCSLLDEMQAYENIILLCTAVLKIDAYQEPLYQRIISAYIDLGDQKTALNIYTDMKDLFFREFGVNPSEQLIAMYRDIIRTIKPPLYDFESIQERLREDAMKAGAFYCELEIFKDIYRLLVRSAGRSGDSIYLCFVTLQSSGQTQISRKLVNSSMDRLQAGIRVSLRRADVYTQYSVCQYLLILQSITSDDCDNVTTRITHEFRKRAPSCTLQPKFSVYPIDCTEACVDADGCEGTKYML